MQKEIQWLLFPRYRIVPHLIFWMFYLAFFTLLYGSFDDRYFKGFIQVFSTLPVKMMATYLTLYVLIPVFLNQRKYITFIGLFFLFAVLFGYLGRAVLHIYYVPTYIPDYDYEAYPLTHLGKAARNMISVFTVVFAATAIKLLKLNFQSEQLTQNLIREKLDAELKFLKGQIHPHFLFNTLNNLYSLTLQNSPKSSEVVLKISNLLDYMLYECNVPRIELRKEIQQLHNLIELERLRYGNRLEVHFSAFGDVSHKQIPPLLMVPFVENAFKHGISKNTEESFISIELEVRDQRLILRVENSKVADDPQSEATYTKGIGLPNVRRRLELIYGKNYDLQIFDEEETFMIVMKIPLETETTATQVFKPAQPNSQPAPALKNA